MAKNKLYVIGNGFDKHHGLPCGYSDFRAWLQCNRPDVYNNLIRIYGECNSDWWSKFEESLACFDPDEYPNEVAETDFFVLKHKLESLYGEEGVAAIDNFEENGGDVNNRFRLSEAVAHFEMEKLKDGLNEAFGEWVGTIGVPGQDTAIDGIDRNAVFFTFNYTKTLEDLYGVDEDMIVHLHGSVDNGVFIIGHGNTLDDMLENDRENAYQRDPDADKGGDEARMELFQVIADELRKPVAEIIEEHKSDFNALAGIEEMIVLGFSYSKIDLPYLKRIIEVTGPDIKVEFGYHTPEDQNNALACAAELGLTNWIKMCF